MTKSSHVSAAKLVSNHRKCAAFSPESLSDITATQHYPLTCSSTGYSFCTIHQNAGSPRPPAQTVSGRLRLLRLLSGGRLITQRGCYLKEVVGKIQAFISQLDCLLRSRSSLHPYGRLVGLREADHRGQSAQSVKANFVAQRSVLHYPRTCFV